LTLPLEDRAVLLMAAARRQLAGAAYWRDP
jgi:hypothetical protein